MQFNMQMFWFTFRQLRTLLLLLLLLLLIRAFEINFSGFDLEACRQKCSNKSKPKRLWTLNWCIYLEFSMNFQHNRLHKKSLFGIVRVRPILARIVCFSTLLEVNAMSRRVQCAVCTFTTRIEKLVLLENQSILACKIIVCAGWTDSHLWLKCLRSWFSGHFAFQSLQFVCTCIIRSFQHTLHIRWCLSFSLGLVFLWQNMLIIIFISISFSITILGSISFCCYCRCGCCCCCCFVWVCLLACFVFIYCDLCSVWNVGKQSIQ